MDAKHIDVAFHRMNMIRHDMAWLVSIPRHGKEIWGPGNLGIWRSGELEIQISRCPGLHRSKGPCDVFDPWMRWERGQVGI